MPPIDAEFDRNAVVTIQGGGVYGLSLLGQLQAVLDAGIQPVALAGTSAGAIVATFHWAGLSPERVRDHFAALADVPGGLVDLIGPFDRPGQALDHRAFVTWARRLVLYFEYARGGGRAAGLYGPVWRRVLRALMLPAYALSVPAWVAQAAHAWRDVRLLDRLVRSRGVFCGANLEREIDHILRTSPDLLEYGDLLPPAPGRAGGRLLTFGDFARVGAAREALFPPLFLTATNLRARALELFDSTDPRYAEVPVARAVRASAGFPLFFQPVDLEYLDRDESYVDGGVICNFPAFVFADAFRRRFLGHPEYGAWARRPWVHIGLRLSDARRPFRARELRDPGAFLGALLALGTGAARTDLEGRLAALISRSLTVEQQFSDTNGPDGVLAVDGLDRHTVGTMFERGRAAATAVLDDRTFRLPDAESVEPLLADLVEQAGLVFGDPGNGRCRFRANVFVPEQGQLVIRYRANMDAAADTDRELEFPFDAGLTGHSFSRRRPVLCNLRQFAAWRAAHPADAADALFGFTAEMQGAVRADRTWLLSVPVMDPFATGPVLADLHPDAAESPHYAELDAPFDGAVFAVLNLDAAFDYAGENLPAAPAAHAPDARIRALVGIMQSLTLRLGGVFSDRFAAVAAHKELV